MTSILENYETVKERKKRFYSDHPDGSLITEIFFFEKGHVVIKGLAYRNKEEQEKCLAMGVGHAEEFQGQGGFANKFSWMENCDESAIGRALDNAGYSGNDKCSKEEVQKVENHKKEKGDINNVIEKMEKFTQPDTLTEYYKSLNQYEWTKEETQKIKGSYSVIYKTLMEAINGNS